MWRLAVLMCLATASAGCLDFGADDPCARFHGEPACPESVVEVGWTQILVSGREEVTRVPYFSELDQVEILIADGGAWSEPIAAVAAVRGDQIGATDGGEASVHRFEHLPLGGTRYLRIVRETGPQEMYVVRDQRVDLGRTAYGRADVTFAPPGTGIAVELQNYTPDSSPRPVALRSAPFVAVAEAVPDAGTVAFPYRVSNATPLLKGSRGDIAYLVGHSNYVLPATSAEGTYRALDLVCPLPAAFDMPETGGWVSTTATCSALRYANPGVPESPSESIALAVDHTGFAALSAEVADGGQPGSTSVVASRGPGLGMHGLDPTFVLALQVNVDRDLVGVALHYEGTLPGTWSTVVRAQHDVQAQILTECCGVIARSGVLISSRGARVQPSATATPKLGPPRSVRINGAAANSGKPHANVSIEPLLSWTAPAVGEPSDYVLSIFSLVRREGATTVPVQIFVGVTDELQFRVPPGVLDASGEYFVVLTARWTDYREHQANPNRLGATHDMAQTITDAFRP